MNNDTDIKIGLMRLEDFKGVQILLNTFGFLPMVQIKQDYLDKVTFVARGVGGPEGFDIIYRLS